MIQIEKIAKPVFIASAACQTVTTEAETWANAHPDVTNNAADAQSVVVLGCQVTEAAVGNDLAVLRRYVERLNIRRNTSCIPLPTFYFGGCLAQREDIDMPVGVERLDHFRCPNQRIESRYVKWARPFWMPYALNDARVEDTTPGMLFRSMDPLIVSGGCTGKCKFCTIKKTRGSGYVRDFSDVQEHFKELARPVIIADNPTVSQILNVLEISAITSKPVALRNVEPSTAVSADLKLPLNEAFTAGRISVFHTPVQSCDHARLASMDRNAHLTLEAIQAVREWKRLAPLTIFATNVIVHYPIAATRLDGFADYFEAQKVFDYVSWNPYWDGIWRGWNHAEAELANWRPLFS